MDKSKGKVEVRKDGQTLRIHPTTVAAHVVAGWEVVKGTPAPAGEQVIEPDPGPQGVEEIVDKATDKAADAKPKKV